MTVQGLPELFKTPDQDLAEEAASYARSLQRYARCGLYPCNNANARDYRKRLLDVWDEQERRRLLRLQEWGVSA